MKFNRRIDANQNQIVTALRGVGATVQSLASLGFGCPDLLVGRQGRNFLLEIKDGKKKPSDQKLTEHEAEWHKSWRGQVVTVNNVMDALLAIGAV